MLPLGKAEITGESLLARKKEEMGSLGGIPVVWLIALALVLLVVLAFGWRRPRPYPWATEDGPTFWTTQFAREAVSIGTLLILVALVCLAVSWWHPQPWQMIAIWTGLAGAALLILLGLAGARPTFEWASLLLGILAIVLIALLAVGTIRHFYGGSGKTISADVPTTQLGDMNLASVEITQIGSPHILVPGKFHDQIEDFVLQPGFAALRVGFIADKGETKDVEVTLTNLDNSKTQSVKLDSSGTGLFLLNLTVDEGKAWRFNPYQLSVKGNERKFEILTEPSITSGGMTGGNMVNTPDELGGPVDPNQPQTVVLEIDPTFVAAFAQFCGFANTDIKKVTLKPNDKPRFQVAWTGTSFVQSQHQIAVGQPIWAAVSKSGDVCYINPPCGNPETVPGKLPLAPPELQPNPTATPVPPTVTPTPGKEVPSAPTNTPVSGSPTPPPAIETPVPPTATPVPPTATLAVPTATPPKATQTAQPPPPPCPCTPTDPNRPTVIPTPRNTIVVPTDTPMPVQTTAPDPQKSQTAVTH